MKKLIHFITINIFFFIFLSINTIKAENKIKIELQIENEIITNVDFKKEQKLTDSDILNKSKSLRGVLDPFDSNEHITTLKKIGFKKAEVVMKIDFFELILAIR